MIAKSLGLRASNSSATRGRPPVMSRVFEHFARDARQHVAGLDRAPRSRPTGSRRPAGSSAPRSPFARVSTSPASSRSVMRGRRSPPRGCCFQSITTFGRDAGRLVEHLAHRDALGEVDVMRDAVLLGDDRDRVRVPLGQPVAARHLDAVVGQQPRAVGHAVPRLLAAGLVDQHHLAVAAHHDRQAGRVDDDVAVLDLDLGVERRLDRGLLGAALRRAADMEGAHRQLGAGLADRLRGDDADRLADIDDGAAREVAPVALAAHADLRLAGQHRADRHRVDAGPLDRVDRVLVDQVAGRQARPRPTAGRARRPRRSGRGCGRRAAR